MPRYGFRCRACGLEFDVSRAMSDAGRDAVCPVDGKGADRLFTAPMISVPQGDVATPATPSDRGRTRRTWSLPFFPKDVATSARAHDAAAKPCHVLPAGSSRPTRFKHFGHWHPAGTPAHTHAPRGPRRPKPAPPKD